MNYITVEEGTAIVKPRGRFDNVLAHEIDPEIDEALINHGCNKIVVDLSETKFIDSSAIRTLAQAFRSVGKNNFEVKNVLTDELAYMLYQNEVDEAWNVTPPLDHDYLRRQFE